MREEHMMYGHILTYTGRMVPPASLESKHVCLEDIAHSLAYQCRYLGHCVTTYTIAQHCVLCATIMTEREGKQAALLHDASEAYLADISSPLKDLPEFSPYLQLEERIQTLIYMKYLGKVPDCDRKLDDIDSPLHHIDKHLSILEMQALTHNWEYVPLANVIPCVRIPIIPWTPKESEERFLLAANLLGICDDE